MTAAKLTATDLDLISRARELANTRGVDKLRVFNIPLRAKTH
jgi:hypothetical protein